MSDPLRIGFVVEGPTDHEILKSIITLLVGGREYILDQLSPILSDTGAPIGGGGWTQVYFWCKQAADESGGSLRNSPLLDRLDILVIHLDADVAGKNYTDDQRISDAPNDLPCERPCPPASATTDALRQVVLGWMGETAIPLKTVLCTPSKALETWILVALLPQNPLSITAEVECHPNPSGQLQKESPEHRLIRGGRKDRSKYRERAPEVAREWTTVRQRCAEAERFSTEFLAAVP